MKATCTMETKEMVRRLQQLRNSLAVQSGHQEGYAIDALDCVLDRLRHAEQASHPPQLTCHICGKPATCIGNYDRADHYEPACDSCCGHGNEDGWCRPIPEAIVEMSKWLLEANTGASR